VGEYGDEYEYEDGDEDEYEDEDGKWAAAHPRKCRRAFPPRI